MTFQTVTLWYCTYCRILHKWKWEARGTFEGQSSLVEVRNTRKLKKFTAATTLGKGKSGTLLKE
jgi:hypothetical protein